MSDNNTIDDEKVALTPSLPKLLAALALGARSCNALPASSTRDEDDDYNSNDENDEDDEFAYQMAFREFNSLCLESRSELAALLNKSLQSTATSTSPSSSKETAVDYEFDDPMLWETAAEACDILLERVDQHIQNVKEGREGLEFGDEQKLGEAIGRVGDIARNKAQGGFNQLIGSLVEMEKPQITYGFAGTVQNSRTEPFVPQLHPEKPFSVNPSYKLELVPGHGLESRQYGGASAEYLQSIPDDIIAPSDHYPHPYTDEINTLEYRPYQLQVESGKSGKYGTSGTLNNPALSDMKGVWIDTEEDLKKLVHRINDGGNEMREIAIDLEAHSFRSFSGFVCLMQLSLRRPKVDAGKLATLADSDESIMTAYDFLIDVLPLRNAMNEYFAPIMANPDIVKVMHGADSDVLWLQRDFGIYIVNLFDTGRASRALPHFSKAGLAYLLSKYADVEADKKHQLSDWRQRPLPHDMLSYAASDTMYLLDIYDKVRLELLKHDMGNGVISISSVLDASKKVCLIRYDKEAFRPDSYKKLVMSRRGNKVNTDLNDGQDAVLKALFDWRDGISRTEDESLQYVCGNSGLVRIAKNCPQTILALKSCVNPLPPLVLKYAHDILRLVKTKNGKGNLKKNAMTPDVKSTKEPNKSGTISPVLDTTDLYERAGWNSPPSNLISTEDDVTSSSDVEMNEITIQASNQDFSSTKLTDHNIEMKVSGADSGGRSRGVNGMGAAKEAMNDSSDGEIVAKQKKNAETVAGRIRESMKGGDQNLLRLVKTKSFISEGDQTKKEEDRNKEDEGEKDSDDNTEFQIPQSVAEIYALSNKNRRKSKKTPVYFSDDDMDEMDTSEVMDIKKAEELISKSGPDGKDYFGGSSSPASSKRQRTKSQDATSVDKGESKKDDVELMIKLGWVKDQKQADDIISEQKQSLESGENGGGKEKNRNSDGEGIGNGNGPTGGKQHARNRRGKRNNQSSTTYDYSKVGSIGVGNAAAVGDNPFFAGAAISGGSLNNSSNSNGNSNGNGNGNGAGKERKKQNKSRKGKSNNYSGGNKTHIYRK